jgi:hypothetical protein
MLFVVLWTENRGGRIVGYGVTLYDVTPSQAATQKYYEYCTARAFE